MKWYHDLYVSPSLKGKERIVKWKMNHNKITLSVYAITFASNPENLLEIIASEELLQKAYPKENLKVIGLAKGKEEALELVRQIIDETYRQTGTTDVWTYLKEQRRIQT